jgi:hypothetical protein
VQGLVPYALCQAFVGAVSGLQTEPFGQKIVFHLQLSDLTVKHINGGLMLFFGFLPFVK